MSAWRHPQRWQALVDGSECPICRRGEPLDIVMTLDSGWLTMSEQAPMPGYTCLVSRIHVVELHELSHDQASAFMADVQRVSRAVAAVTHAVKLNYEIHGNTIPHLHIHFYPRHAGDAFEGGPIVASPGGASPYEPGGFVRMREKIARAIAPAAG